MLEQSSSANSCQMSCVRHNGAALWCNVCWCCLQSDLLVVIVVSLSVHICTNIMVCIFTSSYLRTLMSVLCQCIFLVNIRCVFVASYISGLRCGSESVLSSRIFYAQMYCNSASDW